MTEALDDHSPKLQPSKLDYKLREHTPPPFSCNDKSSEEEDNVFKSKKGGDPCKGRKGLSEANAGLLRSMDPNHPEIEMAERVNGGIAEYHDVDEPYRPIVHNFPRDPSPEKPPQPQPSQRDLGAVARGVIDILEPEGQTTREKQQQPKLEPASPPASQPETKLPPLSQFLITGQDSLPALLSPEANSPEHGSQTLPPLMTQLGDQLASRSLPYSLPPLNATSPSLAKIDSSWDQNRMAQLGPPKIPPGPHAPYSHMSPTSSKDISVISSPASQPSPFWPTSSKPKMQYLYDQPISKSSPITSYPTPTEHASVGVCEASPYSTASHSNGSTPTGTFKCSHPGCNAAPFQTQYLLNSHANVHSQDRPHFCSVEGCPRGPGGKGFKRKNEMIRHGLVHNSPGYVCPFCPDQQHKYPRPDNLQRHVRVHHVDKSKDDPALRNVLAQRPEGSTRGRRRRMNAQ